MAGQRRRLLLFAWHRPGTGFTRVIEALLDDLARDHDIVWMGIGYQGPAKQWRPAVRLLPTQTLEGDLTGAYQARLDWDRLRPDCVLALNDLWYLEHYPRELGRRIEQVPMFGYLPLDGDIPDPALAAGLTGFRGLCTYTRHAASELERALTACRIDTPVHVVGHGVDGSVFHPLPEVGEGSDALAARMRLAQALFGLDEPAWVVLNASRPDPRKRIDLSLAGFARFAAGKPASVRLCLHQALRCDAFVEPLHELADSLDIAERILWWPPDDRPLDDAALNRLYNACAVGLNTSHGEGFGLVSFEHAASGAPQLLPAHPAMRELWGDAAWLLEPVTPVSSPFSPLLMGEVDPDAVAAGLEALYARPARYRELAAAARRRTLKSDLSWSTVAERLLAAMAFDDQPKLIS